MYRHVNILFKLLLSIFLMSAAASAQTPMSSKVETEVADLLKKAENYGNKDPEKTLYYLNRALKYKNEISKKQLLELYKFTAITYSNQQAYISALDYYYKELELQKKIEPAKLHYTYNNIGGTYMALGDTIKARKFWKQSLEGIRDLIKKGSTERKNFKSYIIYNNLALLEIESKNYTKAMKMLNEYKKHSLELKDTANIILAYNSLATVFEKLNQKDSSKSYLHKGIHLAKIIDSHSDLAFLYYDLGFNYNKARNDSASYYLHKSFDFAQQSQLNDVKLSAARALADLYGSKNDYKKSNEYLRIANSLSEENMNIQSQRKAEMLEYEYEQKIRQQEALVQGKRRESILIFSCILLVPLSIIAFLMYRLQRTKAKKREAENELLIQKLEGKNKELTSNAIQMLQASEIIDSTHKELKQLKRMADVPTNNMLNLIISDLKKGNQSFNKKEFEKVFIETDEAFYKKLLQDFPTLTSNEIRLCAFAKMNFSTKDISAITQQSTNSILVARSRLRKKIGLDENQSLTAFLKGF